MKIPDVARYEYCICKANEFINDLQLYHYPIDPFKIISKLKIGLMKYSELSEINKCDMTTVYRGLKSKDGYSQYDGENYAIAYNDKIYSNDRIRFTLMHELGHIYLGHLYDFEKTELAKNDMTRKEYKVLENEANVFARNVLAPSIATKNLNLNPTNISNFFRISNKASEIRLIFLNSDLYHYSRSKCKINLIPLFSEEHLPIHCMNCKNHFILSKNMYFCPICGTNHLTFKGGIIMHYNKGYDLINGQLKACATCNNEDIDDDADFCKICGSPVFNKCIDPNCSQPAEGNARYCKFCGQETSFHKYGLLKSWESESLSNDLAYDDDDLPF